MELAHENGHAEVDATRIRRMKDRKKAHLVMPVIVHHAQNRNAIAPFQLAIGLRTASAKMS